MNDIASVETPTVNTATVQSPTAAKPYDDEMLEAYEAEAVESEPEQKPVVQEAPKVEEPEESTDKPEESEEKVENSEEAPKSTKDDKIIDGVEELSLKKIINGKEVEFKIKDAVQAYTKQEEFNRNMDRRISEVSRREKSWQLDQNEFKGKVSKVIEAAQAGDFVSGIRALAKIAAGKSDLDVVKFEKDYFEQLDKVRDVYTKMTPEQREAYFAKRSAAEARAEADRLKGENANKEAQSQLEVQVQQLQQQHGLSQDEFWGNYKALADSLVGEGKKFNSPNEITADDVVKYSLEVRHWEKVYQAAEALGIEDEAILEETHKITSVDRSLTVDEIREVIKQAGLAKVAEPDVVENLNRKARSSGSSSAASSTKKQNGKVEGLEDEDLEFLYRNQPKAYQRVVR